MESIFAPCKEFGWAEGNFFLYFFSNGVCISIFSFNSTLNKRRQHSIDSTSSICFESYSKLTNNALFNALFVIRFPHNYETVYLSLIGKFSQQSLSWGMIKILSPLSYAAQIWPIVHRHRVTTLQQLDWLSSTSFPNTINFLVVLKRKFKYFLFLLVTIEQNIPTTVWKTFTRGLIPKG